MGDADAGEVFIVGEGDAAVLVIPGVGLVLGHCRFHFSE